MDLKLVLVLALCAFSGALAKRNRPDYFEITTNDELEEYVHNKTKPNLVKYVFEKMGELPFFQLDINMTLVCQLCPLIAGLVIEERILGMTDIQLTAEVAYVCSLLEIEDDRVCVGAIEENVGIFTYMVDNDDIDGTRFCNILLENMNCDYKVPDWTVVIPEGTTIDAKKPEGKNSFKILHLTDVHYDQRYTVGKSINCGEPLCCQSDQADGKGDDRCGYWSNYASSDTPLWTLKEVFSHAAAQEPDMVYFTGDIVSHRVWETSPEDNQNVISTIYDLFHSTFNTSVYFVLGNHEGHPVNIFAPPDVTEDSLSSQWLFDLFLSYAKEDDGSFNDTIPSGGYYTLSPKDGFRLIVLNDNVCSFLNWWQIQNDTDQYGQLQWLANTLAEAEKAEEMVHILAHQPLDSCQISWARQYNRIIERFANTIVGQFFGHSHTDGFYVYYSETNHQTPINVGWNGASVVPDRSNPSYKIYTVDADTFQILEIEEFYFNLTQANLDPKAALEWESLYKFTEVFGVEYFDAAAIDTLAERMAQNHTLIDAYYNFKFRNSDYIQDKPCDEVCQKDILLEITTTVHGVTDRYNSLAAIYNKYK